MFWDKRFKELEKEIKDLKYKTLGEEKNVERKSRGIFDDLNRSIMEVWVGAIGNVSLKERLDKTEEKLDALIVYLKLESKTVTTEASETVKIAKKAINKKK